MKKLILLAVASIFAIATELRIDDIYARTSMKNAQNGAVFMTITNGLKRDMTIVSASSSVCSSTELHEHAHVDGMMVMRQVQNITIPSQSSVKLEPGGLHVMLMGLKKPLANGDKIDLELTFDTGTKLTITDVSVTSMQHKH